MTLTAVKNQRISESINWRARRLLALRCAFWVSFRRSGQEGYSCYPEHAGWKLDILLTRPVIVFSTVYSLCNHVVLACGVFLSKEHSWCNFCLFLLHAFAFLNILDVCMYDMYNMCPRATIYASSHYYLCVLIRLGSQKPQASALTLETSGLERTPPRTPPAVPPHHHSQSPTSCLNAKTQTEDPPGLLHLSFLEPGLLLLLLWHLNRG